VVGAIAPLIQWTLHKKFKISFLKYLNFPVIFAGTFYMPPATPLNYVPWVLICFLCNYVIRRRHLNWWLKYNCGYLSYTSQSPSFLTVRLSFTRSVVRWIGCRLCHRRPRHLLFSSVPEEWDDRTEHDSDMVGQYSVHQNCRLHWCAVQEDPRWWNVWPAELVKHKGRMYYRGCP
jgi:OPT oligopeptide transporter protein